MNETMGQIIKRLRKERELTQEELAEQLGVTYQAISKWENDAGMPDISQVVPLATVFGVPTDVLFGRYGTNDDEEAEKIIAEALAQKSDRFGDEHTFALQYPILTEGLKRFPSNLKLLSNCLSTGACLLGSEYETDTLYEDCMHYADLILKYSRGDLALILNARFWRNHLLLLRGDWEAAKAEIDQYPKNHFDLQGEQLTKLYRFQNDTEAQLRQDSENAQEYLQALLFSLLSLANAYLRRGEYADSVTIFRLSMDIQQLVFGEHMPRRYAMQWEHGNMAYAYLQLGDREGAFSALEEMVDYHTMLKRIAAPADGRKTYADDHPLFRPMGDYPVGEHDAKGFILSNLERSWFDSIREDARFRALLRQAEAL